jgi:hypothetical protein
MPMQQPMQMPMQTMPQQLQGGLPVVSAHTGTPLPPQQQLPSPGVVGQTAQQPMPVVQQAASVPALPLPQAIVPLTDSQLLDAISQADASFTDSQIQVWHCRASETLVNAFYERNKKNRYRQDALWQEYKRMMLTPLKDRQGNWLVGTREWKWSLPVVVFMDSAMSVHNGQHSLFAWNKARQELFESINAKHAGEASKISVPTLDVLGIDDVRQIDSILPLQLVIISGIEPDAANYIDRAKQRTTGDVAYRNRDMIFRGSDHQQFTYDSLAKKGKTAVAEEDKNRLQNQEASYFSTALKIVAWRMWFRGEFARGGSKGGAKFDVGPFESAYFQFPGVADSVHRVFLRLKGEAQFAKDVKWLSVSVPYLMASHYLASMAYSVQQPMKDDMGNVVIDNITKQPMTEWRQTPEGLLVADQFIDKLVSGDKTGDVSGRWLQIERLRVMLHTDPKTDADKPHFDRSNFGLACIFNALGHAFRNYIWGDQCPIPFDTLALRKPYAIYGTGQGFDPMIPDA